MSIKYKFLLVLFLLVLTPTLVAGLLIYQNARETLIQNQVASLEAIAEIKVKAVKDFAANHQQHLEQIRRLPTLTTTFATWLAHVDSPSEPAAQAAGLLLDTALSSLRENYELDVIWLTNTSGATLYSNGATRNCAHRVKHNLQHSVTQRNAPQNEIQVRFFHCEEENKSGIFVMGALGPASAPIGHLVLEIDMERASQILLDNTGLGQTGKTVLGLQVNENHFIHLNKSLRNNVAHRDISRVAFVTEGTPLAMQKAVTGQNGAGLTRNYLGTELIAVWRYLPEFEIGLVAKIDAAEALASAELLKATTLLVLLVVTGIGILLALQTTRSITTPILALQKGLLRVGNGDLDHRLGLTGKDEIGQLARAFDEMTSNLAQITASRNELNREIAERKQAEALLQESEGRLRDLFNNASDLIQSIAPDGSLLFVNRAWEKTLGYSSEEIADMTIFDVIHPDSQQHCQRAFKKLMLQGKGGRFEAAFRTKSGYKIHLEGVVNVQVKDGKPVATRGIFRDITDRKQANDIIKTERRFLQSVIDGVDDPLYVIGLDYEVLLINQAGKNLLPDNNHPQIPLFCYRASHHRDTPCQGDSHPCPLKEVIQCGETVMVEHLHFDPDGTKRHVEVMASPYRNADGRLLGIIETNRDVTERKQLEEQLRQAEKMQAIGQLAGGIAHDFNNQLSGVMGYADLMLLDQGDPRHRDYAQQIKLAAQRSAELIQKLLAFSRKGKYLAVPVDINATIKEVVALLEHSIDKRIRIHQSLTPGNSAVTGDPAQLQNALLNLGINASDAMPEGGDLSFETALATPIEIRCLPFVEDPTSDALLRISVIDTGCGIDEKILPHIFEPFFTTKDTGKGTGMGLASVYGTILGHKGQLDVSSQVGKGTRVDLFLPLVEQAPQHEHPEPPDVMTGNARILLVDDETMVREIAKRLLETLGYQVTCHGSGQSALQDYRENWASVDLVILDMVMPEMDGRETFQAMRTINPKVRAILASGYSLNGRAQQILEDGVSGFIGKPFSRSELAEVVARTLTTKR